MFAVAIWSEPDRRLILARDRMGIKPLYVSRVGENLYFGSELKAVFCYPEVTRTLDAAALTAYCGLGYVPGASTLVEGIEKLAPGSYMVWADGSVRTERYWTDPPTACFAGDLDEAAAELDGLLTGAVREQLHADAGVGLWLSGGLDSSTLLHYASQSGARTPKTFSITFHGREFDESSQIAALTQRYGTEHQQLDLTPEIATADVVSRLSFYADGPNADAGAVPAWFLAEMSARDVRVVLSGEGADELFGGYETYRADRYAHRLSCLPSWMKKTGLRAAKRLRASDRKIGFEYKAQRFLEGLSMDPLTAHTHWGGLCSRSVRGELLVEPNERLVESILGGNRGDSSLRAFLDFDRRYPLPDNLLEKVDRMSAAHSLEARPPFLDHRIVEFAASLPLRFLMAGRVQKRVLRRLMHRRLPRSVIHGKKTGLDIPVHDWLRGHLRPLLLDTLSERAVRASGLLEWPVVRGMIHAHLDRRTNYGYHLWALMMLLLWMEHWKIDVRQDEFAEGASPFLAPV